MRHQRLLTIAPNDPRVEFSHLRRLMMYFGVLPGHLYPLVVPLNCADVDAYVPGQATRARTVPQLAVDPTSPNRLYIVYHDCAEDPDPNDADVDVDVFVRKLTNIGGAWLRGDAVSVSPPDGDPNQPSDQFTPAVTVDKHGHVHVLYYDDRRWPTQDDNTAAPLFDVYYAISTDHASTWDSYRLHAVDPNDPNDPEALNIDYWYMGPREYGGIAHYEWGAREEILTTYTGTPAIEPVGYDTMIYFNRIDDLP